MVDMQYNYAGLDEFANDLTITCHPRTISVSDNELLWQLDEAVTLEPGDEREIGAAFRDDSDNRIGGRNITLANVTFAEDDKHVPGTLTIINAGANRAKLLLRNQTSNKKVKLESAEVRGQKITDFGQMEAFTRDDLSIVKYGRRDMKLNLRSVDNLEDAQGIADFELMRRKEPSGKVKTLSLVSHAANSDTIQVQQLARVIGDRIRVKEAQVDHDGEYFIIGEEHRLSNQATLFESTWYLESATEGDFFMIGEDDIGSGAVLLPF